MKINNNVCVFTVEVRYKDEHDDVFVVGNLDVDSYCDALKKKKKIFKKIIRNLFPNQIHSNKKNKYRNSLLFFKLFQYNSTINNRCDISNLVQCLAVSQMKHATAVHSTALLVFQLMKYTEIMNELKKF